MAGERLRVSQRVIDRYRAWLTTAHQQYETKAEPHIKKMAEYFRGQQWELAKATQARITPTVVNLIYADVKVMLPVLALRNPRVFVKPTKATAMVPLPIGPPDPLTGQPTPVPTPCQMLPDPTAPGGMRPVPILAAAEAQERLINWRWRQLRLNRQVRRVLQDALLAPFGIMKLGYTLETEKVKPPTVSEQMDEAMTGQEGGRTVLDVQDAIKAESPFAVRWSPRDFRVDPEARYPDLSDAGWIAFGWTARLSDLQDNSRYRNTRNLKPTVTVTVDARTSRMTETERFRELDPDEFQRVQLWEIWDKREGALIVLADGHDKALQYDEWPNAHATFPAETLYFTESPDELYGPPDLAQVMAQQDAYNEINALILNHVRWASLRKFLATRGALDEKEMQKLTLAQDGLVVETDQKASEAIIAMPDAPIPVDTWQARANVRDDHDRISGIADFVRGVAENVDTATEASLLQSNLNVRVNDSRDLVEDFAERISSQLLKIDAVTMPMPATIPVVGPDGALALNQWVHVQTRATLQAETSVEVEIGSMQPINEEKKKRDVQQLYSAWKNNPLVNQVALEKALADVYYDALPNAKQLLIPEDVVAQVRAQLEQEQAAQTAAPPGGPPAGARPAPGRPAGPPRPGPAQAAAVAPGQEV